MKRSRLAFLIAAGCGGGDGGGPDAAPPYTASLIYEAVKGDSPWAIVVDESNVYFTQKLRDGRVMQVPKAGGTAVVVAADQDTPVSLVVDATHVYWVDAAPIGRVMKAPIGGGAVPTLLATSVMAEFSGVAVDDTNVFWTTYEESGSIMLVGKSGGIVNFIAMGKQTYPAAIVADESDIYWISFGDGAVKGASTFIDNIASGQVAARSGLALTEDHVYWIDDDATGGIAARRASRGADGTVTELVRLLPAESGADGNLAVDGASIYFPTATCSIAQAPGAGGEATMLSFSEAFGCPLRVAAADGVLYFTSSAGVIRVSW